MERRHVPVPTERRDMPPPLAAAPFPATIVPLGPEMTAPYP
eukprot:CAMPEP_0201924570 /NCGR_PEP_ID=MMETSP0903-20130614/13469_1 /ASSEMBLY_ACC=CAM_ASM_000552 /TAXON_ID=420261 /ORGANISM="Thalassiosira antarctica, Strain CCMP982" /LENGTH=40 /DNA_ID= /DNA_START= /DNA_END= /DNA_ORIENTATION=